MDNILDHVVVQGQRYDIVSPTAFGNYIETIGSACINPDGYAKGSTFLARLGNEQFYYEATAAITQGSTISEGTNCKKTTVTGREAELALEIQTLDEHVDSLNEALANEVTTRATLGAHNLFYYDIDKVKSANRDGTWSGKSYTIAGITFTINDDKTVTVNGTASGLAYLYLALRGTKMFSLPVGSYKGTSTPSGNSAVYTEMTYTDANNARQSIGTDYGAGLDFSVTPGMISSYFDIGFNLYVSQGQTISNVTFKPMIRLASDTDDTYQPYVATNQQLTGLIDVADQNGAKNLLPNSAASQVIDGVTFTVNADGSISTSGTSTAAITFEIALNLQNILPLNKALKISGCPSGGSYNDYFLTIGGNIDGAYTGFNEYGSGENILFSGSSIGNIKVSIIVRSGKNMTGKVFKPMITLADQPNSDYAHYVPYAMTNKELTDSVIIEERTLTTAASGNILLDSFVKTGYTIANAYAMSTIAQGVLFTSLTNFGTSIVLRVLDSSNQPLASTDVKVKIIHVKTR